MDALLYIDATTGGMFIQVLLSGVVGSLVVVKLFWGSLFSVFRRKGPKVQEVLATTAEEWPADLKKAA